MPTAAGWALVMLHFQLRSQAGRIAVNCRLVGVAAHEFLGHCANKSLVVTRNNSSTLYETSLVR